MKRKNLVEQMAEQVISYGGLAATRAQAYHHALECCLSRLGPDEPNRESRARYWAEMFAFGPRARELTADEIACRIPWERAVAQGLV